MKRILIATLIATLLLVPLTGAVDISKSTSSVNEIEKLINENGYINITVQEAFESYLSCYCVGVQIPIDIRRQDEWDDERLESFGDEQVPVHWPNLHLGEGLDEFLVEYADKDVILYCRTGSRSWIATKLLVSNGFTGKLYHMLGGITAWKAEGYPTAISVYKAYDLLTDTGNGIQTPVDVRNYREWNSGRIKTPAPEDPVHYPYLHLGVGLTDFMTKYNDKEVIIYCDIESRSSKVMDILIEKTVADEFNGYAHSMIGGLNAWNDAGYPIAKERARFPHVLESYMFFLNLFKKLIDTFPILQFLFVI